MVFVNSVKAEVSNTVQTLDTIALVLYHITYNSVSLMCACHTSTICNAVDSLQC